MVKTIITLVVVLSAKGVFSQQLKGRLIDGQSGEPLQYANIYVVGKAIGGIAQSDGSFQISVVGAVDSDSIRISYIGYHSQTMLLADLLKQKDLVVKLMPDDLILQQVSIVETAKFKKFGNVKAGRRMTGWGDFQSLRGRTRGLLIEGIECPTKVKRFAFRIAFNDWDSVAFRLNFLKYDSVQPTISLLSENIIFHTKQKYSWVVVELDQYNVIICDRVVVSLEWVDAWGKTGPSSNLLTLALSKASGVTLSKEPEQEFGKFLKEKESPAMYIEVYEN